MTFHLFPNSLRVGIELNSFSENSNPFLPSGWCNVTTNTMLKSFLTLHCLVGQMDCMALIKINLKNYEIKIWMLQL